MMKKDLATSIGVAVLGILISYFVCNLFIGPIEDVSFNTISSNLDNTLVNPDVEVFNYKAINPTVEVYVGDDCTLYNEVGQCVDNQGGE